LRSPDDEIEVPTALYALDVPLAAWTPEGLRDAAAICRHRAAGLRREGAIPEEREARERDLHRAAAYDAAAAICELAATRLSSVADAS
jgi:hypothetical protein